MSTNTASEKVLSIGAEGIDVDQVVGEIQAAVDRKMAEGTYSSAIVARAEKTNLVTLRGNDDFVTFYLSCLRDAVYVDIGDFEIREQRRALAKPLVALKKTIWKLLKFYTYRLWSQQNQVNGLAISAIEAVQEKAAEKIAGLEKRIAELEKQLAAADRKP